MSPAPDAKLAKSAANTIRFLAVDAVEKAKSGHPGLPMGAADVAFVLFSRFLRYDPTAPDWEDRDRFVLSAGHGCMLLYSLLYLAGYDLSLTDLQAFRQWGSKTPGHPEFGHTVGVEATTGPLGQGVANAVGMALAGKMLATRFNDADFQPVAHRVFALASDGDMMEGISSEASSLAGHLGLGNLIVLYDDNGISLDGKTALSFSEDVPARYAAYGWHVQSIDGHDHDQIAKAIEAAIADRARPEGGGARARPGGRRRRPRLVHLHRHQGRRRRTARRLRRAQLPFRREGARDGGDRQRDRLSRRVPSVRLDFPRVFRLHAGRDSLGRAVEAS